MFSEEELKIVEANFGDEVIKAAMANCRTDELVQEIVNHPSLANTNNIWLKARTYVGNTEKRIRRHEAFMASAAKRHKPGYRGSW